ncbi:MAG: nicotinate phosphoribosyltransferase [Planctomycetales bacterium]|nr:nicotinate phosphoribosyltransferase [Planctomycetales bacterium]
MNDCYLPHASLLTDLYQLTMSYGYFHSGMAQRRSVFQLSFRRCPFGGEYAIAAGLGSALDWVEHFGFGRDEIAYLRTLTGANARPLFSEDFLRFLGSARCECDIDAVPEGTAVFPHEPLVRVSGPLWQCQLMETALLNIINFQTLIATKASRVCRAAEGEPVLEFGLRRAQGPDGGLSATRAAMIGGCAATSNVLAGKILDVPVKGTHAHSWVMAFPDEQTAFQKYADAMPNNCVFLVDTYDTLRGVEQAAKIGVKLNEKGHSLVGVRLDSGDFVSLSQEARHILDEHGLTGAAIVGSNDLDEYEIVRLKQQGAKIDTWGVGTRLITGYDQPALGGVYKLAAIEDENGVLQPKMKLSNEPAKSSIPGALQIRRFSQGAKHIGDVLYDTRLATTDLASGTDLATGRTITMTGVGHDLLIPFVENGSRLHDNDAVMEIRKRTLREISRLPDDCLRFEDPVRYPVALETNLQQQRINLMTAHQSNILQTEKP